MKLKSIFAGIALLLLSFISFNSQAQQDAMYTQYMFNMLAVNPAYAGSRDVISMTALYRAQWLGVDGAPRSMTFTGDMPLLKEKLGIGLQLSNDRIGIFSNTGAYASLSYRLRLKKSTLAFGMQAGITQFKGDYTGVQLSQSGATSDVAFSNDVVKILPNIGAGLYYSNDKFYVGISLPSLLSSTITNYSTNSVEATSKKFSHAFLMAGYVFTLSPELKLKPSTLIKYVSGSPIQIDINCNAWLMDKIGFGLSYRSLDALSALLEWQATDQLRFGYAYDWSGTKLGSYTSGSHEIMLRYELGFNKNKVLSPRYF